MLMLLITASAAGSTAATPTPAGTPEDTGCNQPLTDSLSLCSDSFDDGTATIIVYADEPTAVTLTDALGWSQGDRREIARKRGITLDPGRHKLTLPATKWKNKVVLTLSTRDSLVPVFVKDGDASDLGLMPGEPQTSDPWVAGSTMFVLFAAGLPLAVVLVRRHYGGIKDEW